VPPGHRDDVGVPRLLSKRLTARHSTSERSIIAPPRPVREASTRTTVVQPAYSAGAPMNSTRSLDGQTALVTGASSRVVRARPHWPSRARART
jgi:hypothetical protein